MSGAHSATNTGLEGADEQNSADRASLVPHATESMPSEEAEQADDVDRDATLEELQFWAELQDFGAEVTIIVDGQFFCGSLCSGIDFSEKTSAPFRGNPEGTVGQAISSFFDSLVEEYQERKTGGARYRYLHLKNAYRVSDLGQRIPKGGTYMRFDASRISGWFIGILASTDDK